MQSISTVSPFLYSRRLSLDIKYNSADEVIVLLAIEIHMLTTCELQAMHRLTIIAGLLLQSCLVEVSLLGGARNSGISPADNVHRSAAMRF